MEEQANRHIQKFNQLITVYGPDGVDPLEEVTDRTEETLDARRDDVRQRLDAVDDLTVEDFFDADEQADIEAKDNLDDPAAVAGKQRSELEGRLRHTERALTEAIEHRVTSGGDPPDHLDDPLEDDPSEELVGGLDDPLEDVDEEFAEFDDEV